MAACLIGVLWTTPSMVQAQAVNDTLRQKHEKADETEQLMRQLKAQEGGLTKRLKNIQSRMSALQTKILSQEKELRAIQEHEREASKEYAAIETRRQQLLKELRNLLRTIWPVHMSNLRTQMGNVSSWHMADRQLNWLADVYGATKVKFAEVRKATEALAQNLERQGALEREAELQLARINTSKDELLGDKLALRSQLRQVRKKKKTLEAELKDILDDIKQLNYRLQTQKTKKFSQFKRALPWPVKGSVSAGYNPKAKPPRRGLAIATGDGAEVRSVFWGKVVHNDLLRGFGTVVIIYHGFNYYSVYAFMSDTVVQMGQEVEKDEPIGKAGYYPLLGGPGLYFELRFHQKPINPKAWLTSRN